MKCSYNKPETWDQDRHDLFEELKESQSALSFALKSLNSDKIKDKGYWSAEVQYRREHIASILGQIGPKIVK